MNHKLIIICAFDR